MTEAARALLEHGAFHADHPPSPAGGPADVWFHGSDRAITAFGDPARHSASLDWNAYLGVHFAHDRAGALHAARERNAERGRSGTVLTAARLHVTRPRHYATEMEMTDEAAHAAWRAGDLPIPLDVLPRLEREHRGAWPEHFAGSRLTALARAGRHGTVHATDFVGSGSAVMLLHLLTAPDRATARRVMTQVAARQRDALLGAGHDGVTYVNHVEGGLSAVPLSTARIEIVASEHVEAAVI